MILFLFLVFCFSPGAEGVKLVKAKSVLSGEESSTVLECDFDMDVEFCTFFRPDSKEICQELDYNQDLVEPNCIQDTNLQIKVSGPKCQLFIERVQQDHFGTWTCKAMSWDEWTEGSVKLKQYKSGKIEFLEVYGLMTMTAQVDYNLTCELILSEPLDEPFDGNKILWYMVDGDKKDDLSYYAIHKLDGDKKDDLSYYAIHKEADDDVTFNSTLVYYPSTLDDGKKLICSSPLLDQEKFDEVSLKIVKYEGPSNILDTDVSVAEGETAVYDIHFHAYPRIEESKMVKLRVFDSNGEVIKELIAGQSSGKFSVSELEYESEDLHKCSVTINDVQKTDADYSFEVVLDHPQIKRVIPLKLTVKDRTTPAPVPAVVVTRRPDIISTMKPAIIDESLTLDETTTIKIITEGGGFSLFIIIGIIALCIILCVLYYCTCCGRPKKKEAAADPEASKELLKNPDEGGQGVVKFEDDKKPNLKKNDQDKKINGNHNPQDCPNDKKQPEKKRDPDHEKISNDLKDLEAAKADYDAMKAEQERANLEKSTTDNSTDPKADKPKEDSALENNACIKKEEGSNQTNAAPDTICLIIKDSNSKDEPDAKSPHHYVVEKDSETDASLLQEEIDKIERKASESSGETQPDFSNDKNGIPKHELDLHSTLKPVLETSFSSPTFPVSPSQRSELNISISKTCTLKSPDLVSKVVKPDGKYSLHFSNGRDELEQAASDDFANKTFEEIEKILSPISSNDKGPNSSSSGSPNNFGVEWSANSSSSSGSPNNGLTSPSLVNNSKRKFRPTPEVRVKPPSLRVDPRAPPKAPRTTLVQRNENECPEVGIVERQIKELHAVDGNTETKVLLVVQRSRSNSVVSSVNADTQTPGFSDTREFDFKQNTAQEKLREEIEKLKEEMKEVKDEVVRVSSVPSTPKKNGI